jgi:hypothetical protein
VLWHRIHLVDDAREAGIATDAVINELLFHARS